jgi:hypothetical protein
MLLLRSARVSCPPLSCWLNRPDVQLIDKLFAAIDTNRDGAQFAATVRLKAFCPNISQTRGNG